MRDRPDRTGELDSLLTAMKTSDGAVEITRASKSNLAFAFIAMSGAPARHHNLLCLLPAGVDDIADDNQRDPETKRELALWRQSLRGETAGRSALAKPVRDLTSRYPIRPGDVREIITGVGDRTSIFAAMSPGMNCAFTVIGSRARSVW